MSFFANPIFGSTPFITRGILYRNDFTETGSIISTNANFSNPTYTTDGDILSMSGTFIGGSANINIYLNLSGSPITPTTNDFLAIRGSVSSPSVQINVFVSSGSIQYNTNIAITTGSLTVYTGSLAPIGNNYIDKLLIQFTTLSSGTFSGSVDFIQIYTENLLLNYITNQGSYDLKRRVIELDAPMREQGIVQNLGSSSPIVDLDGIFITDNAFTAQQYRDKIINVWQEGNYQWLQSDFIQAKFIVEDVNIAQLAGIQNYYKFTAKLRQYTPSSATLQNYDLI